MSDELQQEFRIVMMNNAILMMSEAMVEMGIDLSLVWTQMGLVYQRTRESFFKTIREKLGNAMPGGFNIPDHVPEILNFLQFLFSGFGLGSRSEILEVSDAGFRIRVTGCVFAQACNHLLTLHQGEVGFLTPCFMNSIVYGMINMQTAKHCNLESFKIEGDTCTTEVSLYDYEPGR